MEYLSQNHDIAPELAAFLADKLKQAKDALEFTKRENKQLREELNKLQSGSHGKVLKPKSEGDPSLTCRAGICTSIDKVYDLTEAVRTLGNQLEVQSQEHWAEVADLQARLEHSKSKYSECKAKLNACRKELEDVERMSVDEEGDIESGHVQNESIRDQRIMGPVAMNDQESRHETQQEDGNSQAIEGHVKHCWQQLASTVCLPLDVRDPCMLPPEIRQLSSHGFLFFPDCTMVDDLGDSAWIYLPHQRCTSAKNLNWTNNHEFDIHRKKTRDLFYENDEGICYAGSFICEKASKVEVHAFRRLERKLRNGLFRHTFQKSLGVSPAIWEKRVDFNQPLYDAMTLPRGPIPISLPRNSTAAKSGGQKKRKAAAPAAAPASKKRKH